jgi:NADPH:quinone reductase-like Zn-dependent oxidoreductase
MRAVVIHETGDPDVLQLEDIDMPKAGDGELLIRVHAASVNPVDWKYRRGFMEQSLPNVLGRDGSGVVEESNDDRFAVGDEVFGNLASGGYAEYATAPADGIAKKPAGVSHEQAATIPVAGLTAWQPLFDKAGLERGQSVLITGAAGGVGHFAVQFARVAGIRAIGTGSTRNRDFVLGLGADQYVDYSQEDVSTAVSGVDLALDTVGGDVTATVVPTVREGGLILTIASAPPEEAAAERGARAELHVTSPNPGELTQVADLIASGEVKVELSEVLPLDQAQRAHELSESGHVRGKIVLKIA